MVSGEIMLTFNEFLNEAKNPPTKEKLVAILTKGGFNPKDAVKMVDQEYDGVISAHKGSTPGKMAEIISALWSKS